VNNARTRTDCEDARTWAAAEYATPRAMIVVTGTLPGAVCMDVYCEGSDVILSVVASRYAGTWVAA
jgi:hypothetical protein